MHPIIILLFAHFSGDFIFQGNKIASMKSKSLKWLSLHVLIYMGVLAIAASFVFQSEYLIDFVLINGALHWITDLITSRINARLYKIDNKHWFYIGIGFDQFIHAVCLIYTFEYYSSLHSFPYFFQLIVG